jgi:hypothetical protein
MRSSLASPAVSVTHAHVSRRPGRPLVRPSSIRGTERSVPTPPDARQRFTQQPPWNAALTGSLPPFHSSECWAGRASSTIEAVAIPAPATARRGRGPLRMRLGGSRGPTRLRAVNQRSATSPHPVRTLRLRDGRKSHSWVTDAALEDLAARPRIHQPTIKETRRGRSPGRPPALPVERSSPLGARTPIADRSMVSSRSRAAGSSTDRASVHS